MRRSLLVSVVLALGLAGCGVTQSSTSDEQSQEAAGKPVRLTKAEARATAKAMLIRKSDLPGWAEARLDHDAPDACLRLKVNVRPNILLGDAHSAFRKLEEGAVVVSGAMITRTTAQARKAFTSIARVFNSAAGRRCLSAAVNKGAAKSGGSSALTRIGSLGYRVGERSSGLRMAFRVRVNEVSVRGYMALVFIQQKQALAFVLSSHAVTPLPREREVRLANLVARRMKAAQAALHAQA